MAFPSAQLLLGGRRSDRDRGIGHLELRGHPLERLPSQGVALQVRDGRLVGERAGRMSLRNDPGSCPEIVGRRIVAARMRAVRCLQLRIAARDLYEKALDSAGIERLAILIENAEAEDNFF